MEYQEAKELVQHIINWEDIQKKMLREVSAGGSLKNEVTAAARSYAIEYGNGRYGEIFSEKDINLVAEFFHGHFGRKRLLEIAGELEPIFKEAEAQFKNNEFDAWFAKKEEYAQRVRSYSAEIGRLTKNSEDNIKCALGVFTLKGDAAKPEFIKNVARYDSFNDKLWSRYSGMESTPTWSDEEILGTPSFNKFLEIRNARRAQFDAARAAMGYVDPARINKPMKIRKP